MPELNETGHEKTKASPIERVRAMLPWFIVLVLAPATIAVGAYVGSRSYVIVSTLVVIYSLIPFFIQFERRKPQARELVALAVMIALTVAARAAFVLVPNFKPMAALVMITGIAFGASPGLLCGSVSMLVSNFIFGQGPWTPFQMLAYGLCGFTFGFLADRKVIPRGSWSKRQRVAVSAAGFAFCLLIAGPILDTSSVFWIMSSISAEGVITIYLAGVPMNLMQAIATFITLFLIGNAMLSKLERVKVKYGMMQG